MPHLVAVDTGGTFTDLVTFDVGSNRVAFAKTLTTYHDPVAAIATCIEKAKVPLPEAVLFKHGTTFVINALLERAGARSALVTTKGFRDILDFGRGNRPEPYNLFFRRDPVLIPRHLRFEVDERVGGDGRILRRPDRSELVALSAELKRLEIRSVAISFLNAYREPHNERLVMEWLRELMPDCFVCCGSDLSREWHEYERTATAVAGAYAGPAVNRYISSLVAELDTRRFPGKLCLMGSAGGILSAESAVAFPVHLVESGPIGGCIGSAAYAKALSIPRAIAFDMGGTTAKCALIEDGGLEINSTYYVGGYSHGFPIRAPVVDIVEVGAGGGSIAWLDAQNRLHVGPRSAGASPGPVAYRRGGLEPTITDANLVLGRISPASFQQGEIVLDVDAARDAFATKLAGPLKLHGGESVADLAAGIIAIANVTMAGAIKRITVERGKDPRDYVLFAYGGNGPLHAAELARGLHIPTVIVPPEPGLFSALGMLLADLQHEQSRTVLEKLSEVSVDHLVGLFDELEAELVVSLEIDCRHIVQIERSAEMRYVGQYHTLRIPFALVSTVDEIDRTFKSLYRDRYGYARADAAAEIVGIRSVVHLATDRPSLEGLVPARAASPLGPPHARAVYWRDVGLIEMPVMQRSDLPIGFSQPGPAIIEQYGSTTLVGPNDTVSVGPLGELRIEIQ